MLDIIKINSEEDLLNLKNIADKQKIEYICQNCGKVRKQYYFSLKENLSNLKFCAHCKSVKKAKGTFKQKYGVDNPNKLKSTIEKRRKTNLKKYGVEIASKSEKVKEKHNQTLLQKYGRLDIGQFGSKEHLKSMLIKYGVYNPQKLESCREKTKKTCLEKYGTETPLQNETLREKGKITSLKHFGTEFPQQSKTVKEKTKQTNLEKYNSISPLQNENIKKKIKEQSITNYNTPFPNWSQKAIGKRDFTNLEKFGTKNVFANKQVREKIKNTLLEKYGVENYSQTDAARTCRRKQYYFDSQFFDSKPELCFYIYCKEHNLNIKRNMRSFEYIFENKKHYYFPDFEIDGEFYEIKGDQFLNEETNTWYNPYDSSQNELYKAKHKCALDNNVKILYTEDYQKYLNYVEEKYGKDYFKKLIIKQLINFNF